jgi:hypothetical protein
LLPCSPSMTEPTSTVSISPVALSSSPSTSSLLIDTLRIGDHVLPVVPPPTAPSSSLPHSGDSSRPVSAGSSWSSFDEAPTCLLSCEQRSTRSMVRYSIYSSVVVAFRRGWDCSHMIPSLCSLLIAKAPIIRSIRAVVSLAVMIVIIASLLSASSTVFVSIIVFFFAVVALVWMMMAASMQQRWRSGGYARWIRGCGVGTD